MAQQQHNAAKQEVEEWAPEDDVRVVGLLDDGTKASIATMFMGRETEGFIVMDQLMEIMTELQVAFDTEQLAAFVPEEQWDRLDLPTCNVVIGRLIENAQKAALEEKEDTGVVVTQATTQVVYLGTCEYLSHVLSCSTKEETVEYRWQRPEIDIRPKTTLMVSVAVMMLIAAGAMIGVMVGLNEYAIKKQAKDSVSQFGSSAFTVSSTLIDKSTSYITAAAFDDSSLVLASLTDSLLYARRKIKMEQLQVGVVQFRQALAVSMQDILSNEKVLLDVKMRTLSTIFSQTGNADGLKQMLQEMQDHGVADVLAVDTRNTIIVAPPYSSTTDGDFTCIIRSRASGQANGTGTLRNGTKVYYSGVHLGRQSVTVCLMKTTSQVASVVQGALDDVVTKVNTLRQDTSDELEAAVVNGSNFIVVGGRKSLPVLCVRNGVCSTGNDIFKFAVNTSRSGYAEVVGYDEGPWLASYALMTTETMNVALGMKQNDLEDKNAYYTALGTGTTSVSNVSLTPAVVFAVADALERVEVLPINESHATSVEVEYLGFALRQRTGISYPQATNPDSVLAAYAPATAADVAVALEVSSYGAAAAAADLVGSIIKRQNEQFPSDRELLLLAQSPDGSIFYVVTPHTGCRSACKTHGVAAEAFANKNSGRVETTDQNGDRVLAWYGYINSRMPLVVVAQISKHHLDHRVEEKRYVGLAIGFGIMLFVQLVIMVMTRRVLNRIENNYNKYKRQIEEEKRQFSELVKDVMPPHIAERIMKGTRLIAETHQQLTFFFSDIVGSTETSKAMTNKQLVRMLGYSFMLEDEIASFFGVYKIKTLGDAYFAVSGLEDSAQGVAAGKDNQVYRMASFACVTQQLFGTTYAHYPERTECFAVSANGQELGQMQMVKMRMGMHTGPAVAGVVDVGRAPHFDCFGPSVNLASRMESTSTAGRVQVSQPTMELLSKLDEEHLFEFEAPRKTLVKGYGTMVTYLIKSTNLHVPEELIVKLHIERAATRQVFSGASPEQKDTRKAKVQSSTPENQVRQQQQEDEEPKPSPVVERTPIMDPGAVRDSDEAPQRPPTPPAEDTSAIPSLLPDIAMPHFANTPAPQSAAKAPPLFAGFSLPPLPPPPPEI